MPRAAIGPLVDAVAAEAPDLPGVHGEAATVAAFAGTWTERFGGAAEVVEGQRLYAVDEVRPPSGVPGALRVATDGDVELLAAWFVAFHDEVGESAPIEDPVAAARAMVDQGRLWVWEHDGEVVASVMITRPAVDTARIGFVYTPPDARGHGRAAAAVSALVARALAPDRPLGRVERCVLYTQLQNAVSNRVYRRIGFRSVSEVLVYGFVRPAPPA
jgi:predicted GNAT family acetyltransferase